MSQRIDLILNCINDTQKGIQDATSALQSLSIKVSAFNYAIQSSYNLAKDALDKVVFSVADMGDELYKMSQRTGMAVEELYALKNVAQLSNINLGDLRMTFSALARSMFEARTQAGESRAIFQALGVDYAKPLNQVFIDLAKRFSEIRDGEDKLAIATRLFGRDGSSIIPILNDIANGALKTSDIFSGDLAKASSDLTGNFTKLKQSFEEVSIKIGSALIPAINQLFDDIKNSRGAAGFLVNEFVDMGKAIVWLVEPFGKLYNIYDSWVGKARDATMAMFGFNQEAAKAEHYITGSPTRLGQLGFTFGDVKKPMPSIVTDEQRKKFVDNEQAMAEAVDKAGQEIIDNLNRQAQARDAFAKRVNAARESEIQMQLKEIDLAQQNYGISTAGAAQQRVQLYRELLEIQQEYLNGLDKERDPSSWYAQQDAINSTREALVKLNLVMKEQTGTLAEGMAFGFQKFAQDANTAFQSGEEFAQRSAQAMTSAFSGFFFNAMQGKFSSFRDVFAGFINSIQKALSDMLAQMAMKSLFGGLGGGAGGFGGLFAGLFGSGATTAPFAPVTAPLFHSGGYIPRFHSGGLGSDEVPAILQRGEYVLQRSAVNRLGVDALASLNNGASIPGGGSPMTVIINTIDAESTQNWVAKNKDLFATAVMTARKNNHPERRR